MMLNGSNAVGRTIVPVNRQQDMAVFDALPPEVRAEIRESVVKWSTVSLAQPLLRGRPIQEVIQTVRDEDRSVISAYRRRCGL